MIEAAEIRAAGGLQPERGRIAVYSCHFGGYEPFFTHALGPEGDWDRIIFTDLPDLDAPGRRLVHMPTGFDGLTPKALSRLPKLWPEPFLGRYDWVIYADNRARLLMSPTEIVARIEAGHGGTAPAGRYLAEFPFGRSCAWREARICHRKGFLSPEEYSRITARFEADGFPRDYGLFMNTALVQRMGDGATGALNRAWFEAFTTLAGRDQVLLPYLLFSRGLAPRRLPFPLTEMIQWPVFGKRIRRRFQEGLPLPQGWDDPSRFAASDGEED